MDKTGQEYEIFVAKLQQAILDSEEYVKQKISSSRKIKSLKTIVALIENLICIGNMS